MTILRYLLVRDTLVFFFFLFFESLHPPCLQPAPPRCILVDVVVGLDLLELLVGDELDIFYNFLFKLFVARWAVGFLFSVWCLVLDMRFGEALSLNLPIVDMPRRPSPSVAERDPSFVVLVGECGTAVVGVLDEGVAHLERFHLELLGEVP